MEPVDEREHRGAEASMILQISRAVGRAFASSCLHALIASATSCGHSSGTLHSTFLPLSHVSLLRQPLAALESPLSGMPYMMHILMKTFS